MGHCVGVEVEVDVCSMGHVAADVEGAECGTGHCPDELAFANDAEDAV